MKRIAEPKVVVSDGGTGFKKALKKVWPNARHQRCVFHVFCQVKRYTTSRPNTIAGVELYGLARDLFDVNTRQESEEWTDRFVSWIVRHQKFLSEMTVDEQGNSHPTHERLVKAEKSIERVLQEKTLFTYLDEELCEEYRIPATNNRIEGGVNAQLRAMLHTHRGLSVERRIKAVYWWCYLHSPEPLPTSEIIKVMPTDQSIASIYQRMQRSYRVDKTIPNWGDAIVWGDLHKVDKTFNDWD